MGNLKHETVTEGAILQDRTVLVQADYLVVGAGAAGMAFVTRAVSHGLGLCRLQKYGISEAIEKLHENVRRCQSGWP